MLFQQIFKKVLKILKKVLTNVFKSSNIDDVVANEHKKHIKNAEENEVKMMQKTQQKIF